MSPRRSISIIVLIAFLLGPAAGQQPVILPPPNPNQQVPQTQFPQTQFPQQQQQYPQQQFPQQQFPQQQFPQQQYPQQQAAPNAAYGQQQYPQQQPATPPVFIEISPTTASIKSPYRSLPQNEQLLDSLGVRLVLALGYRAAGPTESAWKLHGLPGVKAERFFLKNAEGFNRTLEIGLSANPQGGFDFIVYGAQTQAGAPAPPDAAQAPTQANLDLTEIRNVVQKEIARLVQSPATFDHRQLAHFVYDLSYADSDRAIGLLKAMGYTTVEYAGDLSENINEKIYRPLEMGTGQIPIIVKLIDPTKTSLMDPPTSPTVNQIPSYAATSATGSTVPEIGGTYLHQATSGEPDQRLLILYDKDDPDTLQNLLNLLRETIDVPSRQIMIEALVVEVTADYTRELGVTMAGGKDSANAQFGQPNSSGVAQPFILTFDTTKGGNLNFKAQLNALVTQDKAQILSSPSVLVLNGRQARVQIGQEVPVVKSVATQAGVVSSVDYFPVGIVLNLRPRVSEDGNEITMQAETIVSSVDQFSSAQAASGSSQVLLAPVIDNRQVQTLIRVANDTPFIIGGLISTQKTESKTGIPFLEDLPYLGKLFSQTTTSRTKREVIVVVTPHVVPLEQRYLSYVLPKDSETFDRFNQTLFRDAYRVRGTDLFDLGFITQNKAVQDLRNRVNAAAKKHLELQGAEPFASVLKGNIPGEAVLVRRMMWEIIDRLHYAEHIQPDHIILFENRPDASNRSGMEVQFLNRILKGQSADGNATVLKFSAAPGTPERPFSPPSAVVSYVHVSPDTYPHELNQDNQIDASGNRPYSTVVLSDSYSGIRVSPMELLKGILVLKRVLDLNRSTPLTLSDFHVGRQILFPTSDELRQAYHLVDSETARLFYEVFSYYAVFGEEFNRQSNEVTRAIEKVGG